MYRAKVEAISGLKVRAGGKWLTCIGNRTVNVGDMIWTDGHCVYGNDREGQAPFVVANPELPPIPLLFFDTVPTARTQNISSAFYTLFPTKTKMDYQEVVPRYIRNNLFFVNNKTECQFPAVVLKTGVEQIADVAVNLDNQQDTYELQKCYDEVETITVRVIKNGHILSEIDCSQKFKEFKSEMLKYVRDNAGNTVSIPQEHRVIVYDPDSLHLFLADDVLDIPNDAEGYLITFPLDITWAYYGIEAGKAYFDASIEGVVIKKGKGWIGSLYPGSPQNRPWYDVNTAQSDIWWVDLGVPWGVIEDEKNWAFMCTAIVNAYADGYYESGGEAIPKGARIYARKTWLYTPTGTKEIYHSIFGVRDDNDIFTPIKNQQSYSVSDLIPIQDGYYFTINGTEIYWSGANFMNDKQNIVMMNISVYDDNDDELWTGNIVAGTYLTICKNKKIWLGVDDRGGFGLYDPEFNISRSGYSAASGDLASGIYLLSQGQLEKIIGGYLKNQKLRPMKKYKNWWERIQTID